MKKSALRVVGLVGVLACLVLFIRQPSWPTPDKLLIFVTFIFMIFAQGRAVFKRLAPFVVLLLAYESFRGIVPSLNEHVNYLFMPDADKFIFLGRLPTVQLQSWFWNGQLQWYDFLFYLVYMLHFILPVALALLIWKFRASYYWRYITTFLVLSFAGFFTFLAFPAAPPWMASDRGYIEPISRISSSVWSTLGIHDFPSLYNRISPNPVAAVPSLHTAYAALFTLFLWRLFGKKWGIPACVYPLLIAVGTVYQGEHYVIDVILGVVYAVVSFYVVARLWHKCSKTMHGFTEK